VRDANTPSKICGAAPSTITNIGALGGTAAIPIINYPEVAISASRAPAGRRCAPGPIAAAVLPIT
jgi:pyruvate/2-oxoglutarate dehydrogenase complex dihydrolipoamide acyltransferase (E2) component